MAHTNRQHCDIGRVEQGEDVVVVRLLSASQHLEYSVTRRPNCQIGNVLKFHLPVFLHHERMLEL